MEINASTQEIERTTLNYDLGTFEGFSFRDQCAIERSLTAEEVVNWNHDTEGEAEFWPSGDNEGVALVFNGKTSVTYSEIVALDELLKALGGDTDENFLKIYSVESYSGTALPDLDAATIEDEPLQIFYGDHAYEVRKAAAFELFELYYPELYKMYDECNCDGLKFDIEAFLGMPCFCVEEVKFGNRAVLLVSSR